MVKFAARHADTMSLATRNPISTQVTKAVYNINYNKRLGTMPASSLPAQYSVKLTTEGGTIYKPVAYHSQTRVLDPWFSSLRQAIIEHP